ncbi:arylsulfatase-like [Amphiura filiformis]|uniref:arylsulfatase-like n=1 Tax=Amphiura filiformis TaxID=82378 RepID=UPI003B223CCD
MGYADIASYGHPSQEWGPIDDMAMQGMRFTNFYAPSSTCTPSRAGLLTGRMPQRSGVYGEGRVFFPSSTNGLPREEVTMAEALKDEGYATGFVGKWHLGVNAHSHNDGEHLPYNHGFDYVGTNLPLSNGWHCDEEKWHMSAPVSLMCLLYKNATIYQQPYSHYHMSEAFVDDAIDFMRGSQQQRKPFFLYYGIAQPHVDVYSNFGFRGSSKRGRYGDMIREMSWSVGAIMDEVKRLGEDSNTISIFTSDNGPHLQLCNEGGDAGVLKGGKMQFWEGGIRVPGIFRWTGHIPPAKISDEIVSQLDIFPTLMSIVGGSVPDDRKMDGQDISSTLFNWSPELQPKPVTEKQLYKEHVVTNTEPRMLVFYCEAQLFAVRYGNYKFHLTTQQTWTKEGNYAEPGRCGDGGFPLDNNVNCGGCNETGCVTNYETPLMYNICKDPNEAYPLNVSLPQHKAVLDEMMPKLEAFKADMVIAPPLLDSKSNANIPCCTPETFPVCTCNYLYEGPVPHPGSA